MMPTVLAYTSPAMGHLFPLMPLLLELRARGHRVHVRTLASQVGMVRAQGLEAEPIDPRIEAITLDDYAANGPVQALSAFAETVSERGAFDAPDLLSAARSVRPDATIVDINSWGALCAAEALGGAWTSFSPFSPSLRSHAVPPFGPGLAPMAGPLGKARDALVRRLTIGAVEKAFMPRLTLLRAAQGLGPVRDTDAFFRRSPLLLVMTAEPFEYPRPDWGENVRLIGALPWEPPAPTPRWVEDPGDPFVLVTTSSEYQADESLARAAVEGLGGEPYRVVVTMPAAAADLGPLPPNVRVERFIPHGPILERAAVAVTHGGMGATQKALAAGVPCVVVPFGRDQLEVAARVVHSGAGVRIAKGKLSPERLREAVHRAVGLADGARRVAAGYRAAGGALAGADAVEALVGATSPDGQKLHSSGPEAASEGSHRP
ncbi:glycosyltransferase [Sinomonas flava]|uniref:glycosyltransferase n=1 Tax=Sinomonas flava TaxID=496857 RepID=UPI0039A59302